jgi:hypothetical protein
MLGILLNFSFISLIIAVWFSIRLGLAVSTEEEGIMVVPAVVSLVGTWGIALASFAESLSRMPQ